MPSPPWKAESANWYNSMSQINVPAGAALNFINFGPLYWRWLA